MYEPILDPLAPASIDRMRRHVERLALEHGVAICGCKEMPSIKYSSANTETRTLHIKRINGPISYAVALHELGHLAAPMGHGMKIKYASGFTQATGLLLPWDHDLQLVEEFTAWDWARKRALVWTPTMSRVQQWALRTYELGRRHDAKAYTAFVGTWLGRMLVESLNTVGDVAQKEAA